LSFNLRSSPVLRACRTRFFWNAFFLTEAISEPLFLCGGVFLLLMTNMLVPRSDEKLPLDPISDLSLSAGSASFPFVIISTIFSPSALRKVSELQFTPRLKPPEGPSPFAILFFLFTSLKTPVVNIVPLSEAPSPFLSVTTLSRLFNSSRLPPTPPL